MSCYIIALIIGFAGQALARAIHFGLGSPVAGTGEYIPNMLLSSIGKWILQQYDSFEQKKTSIDQVNPWKLFTCPVCLSVWITTILFFSIGGLTWPFAFIAIGSSHYFVTKR